MPKALLLDVLTIQIQEKIIIDLKYCVKVIG